MEQNGYTAFHYAAFADKEECLALLVSEYHVNPNETDNVSIEAKLCQCSNKSYCLVSQLICPQ